MTGPSRAFYLWLRIYQCDDKEKLPDGAWNKLKRIAENIYNTEFSGTKEQLGEKLLHALEFFDWNDLRTKSSIEDDLQLLANCYKLARKKYNSKVYSIFDKGDKVKYNGKYLSGDGLKQAYNRIRKPLGISSQNKQGMVSLKMLAEEQDKTGNDLVATYMRLRSNSRV